MADPKLISKKRKQPSHPLAGIFTRSKSQIYVHRNRSGRARPDSFSPLDLRARRVFSDGCGFNGESEEEMVKSCSVTFGDAKARDDEGEMEKLDSGCCSQFMNVGCRNSKPSSSEAGVLNEEGLCDVEVRDDEECLQTTPADEKLEFVTMAADQFAENQSNGSNQKNDSYIGDSLNAKTDKRNGTNFRTTSFRSPSSRVKLFKAPGSFSYRRLLPYLMDITRDDSCSPKMGNSLKIGKVPVENQILSSHHQEALKKEPKIQSSPVKSDNVDSINKSYSKPIECIQKSSMLFDSKKEVSTGRNFSLASVSMIEEWSNPIFDRGTTEYVVKISSKHHNLKKPNPDLFMEKDDSVTANSDHIIPVSNGESETSHAEDNGKDSEVCQSSEVTNEYKTEGLHRSDEWESPVGKNPYLTNSNLSGEEQNGKFSNSEQRGDDDIEAPDHADNSNEEYVQTTPLDADIFCKPELVESHVDSVKFTFHAFDHGLRKPLGGKSKTFSSCIRNKSMDCNPKQNPVLKRCSRLKLFKTPGSMSYRRMLPFLMDATKENPCAPGKCNCLKLERSGEENLHSLSLFSACQEMSTTNSNGNYSHSEIYPGSSNALQIYRSTASINDQGQNLSSNWHINASPKIVNSHLEWGVHFEQNISDTDRKLETAPENMDIIHESKPSTTPLCSLSSSGSFPREDVKLVSHESSASTREDCRKSVIQISNSAQKIEPESLYQDLSQLETSLSVPVHKKGILKTTPQGCRGPCNCLNCSSFRLHAERAFEFSRNQMQAAEEVTLHLIKELTYIRNMLEKSAFNNGYAVVCINQVKDACRRASEAEILAQNRLGEMNFDLNTHCRLTCVRRPRVRFAKYVEEKFITKSDLQSK